MKTDARAVESAFINIFSKEAVSDQYLEYSAESDEGIIFEHLRFAEKIFSNSMLMLCPISHVKSKYVGGNCESILGYDQKTLMAMSLADFFQCVHPEDLPGIQQCLTFIKGLEPYDPATHRFLITFRFRDKHGTYRHIRDEKLAIKTASGKYLYLTMFTRVPEEEKFYQVRLDVHKNLNGRYIRSYTYNPRQPNNITPRQHDIARLIVKGFTNQEIADQLRVSVYTVKNHKQMLFRKVNVKSSGELAHYVRRTGT